jgi:hypothetical protein
MINYDYSSLVNRANDLKKLKAGTSNYFEVSSIADDYETLVQELLLIVERQQIDISQLERLSAGKKKKYYD